MTGIRARIRGMIAAAAGMLLAASAFAGGPPLDFDQGRLDAGAVLRQARQEIGEGGRLATGASPASTRMGRDCVQFDFEPQGASRSPAVWLRSYMEECRYFPGDTRYECWRTPFSRKVQVEIVNRQPVLPWERESFQACLEGPWLSFHKIAEAYDYRVDQPREGRFVLTPGHRVPMDPDPAGITAGPPRSAGQGLFVEFSDRWASFYGGGERTLIRASLYEDAPWAVDPELAELDESFDPAPGYRLDFSRFGVRLEPGKKYYLKWGFRRLGGVSKPTLMKRGETERAALQPAS